MSDKELLELAAKAAALDAMWLDPVYETEGMWLKGTRTPDNHQYWRPLTDDGDAFRLMVDLGLSVYPVARTTAGQACSAVGTASAGRLSEAVNLSDTRAATRRAIVIAAAQIGGGE